MEMSPETPVSFAAKHLPAELMEVLKEHIHGNDLSSFALTGKVLSRLPKPAKGYKVAVDTMIRDANLSTKALTPLKDDRPLCTRPRQHIDYFESDEESEFELGDPESDESESDEVHDAASGGRSSSQQPRRTGPTTAANARASDWKRVENIATDERSVHGHGHVSPGRLNCDPVELSEMSNAQNFVKFFPLQYLEPLFPQWNAAAHNKQSPVRGFHTIDRAWFVGWLALWIVMMVVNQPTRRMYWEKSPAYSCACSKSADHGGTLKNSLAPSPFQFMGRMMTGRCRAAAIVMCENGMTWLPSTGVLPTSLELSSPKMKLWCFGQTWVCT
jgi:hypothetical protein